MDTLMYIVKNTLYMLFEVLSILMLLRTLWQLFFDREGDSRFAAFLYAATEPIILPIRTLCYKMNWFQQTPIDVPYLLTYFVLMALQILVSLL